jgi:hypothetical protein
VRSIKPRRQQYLLESGLLFFALAAYFFPEPQVQAFALLILWAFLLKKNSPWAWLCLILCSCLPLLLSPQALNANHISLQNYYAFVQSSPIYCALRLWGDPWVGSWIYEDSPFHFDFEALVNLRSGIALGLVTLSLWAKRRFAAH